MKTPVCFPFSSISLPNHSQVSSRQLLPCTDPHEVRSYQWTMLKRRWQTFDFWNILKTNCDDGRSWWVQINQVLIIWLCLFEIIEPTRIYIGTLPNQGVTEIISVLSSSSNKERVKGLKFTEIKNEQEAWLLHYIYIICHRLVFPHRKLKGHPQVKLSLLLSQVQNQRQGSPSHSHT